MNIVSFLYLGFFNFLLNSLTKVYVDGSIIENPNLLGGFGTFSGCIGIADEVYNIFAWIDVFIDIDLCLTLFLLTSLFYGLKLSFTLAKRVLSLFKK